MKYLIVTVDGVTEIAPIDGESWGNHSERAWDAFNATECGTLVRVVGDSRAVLGVRKQPKVAEWWKRERAA